MKSGYYISNCVQRINQLHFNAQEKLN